MKSLAIGIVFLIAIISFSPNAQAQNTISINFVSGFDWPVSVGEDHPAGVIANTKWNNVNAGEGTSGTSGDLNDHAGAATTATVSWEGYPRPWPQSPSQTFDGDFEMFADFLLPTALDSAITVTLDGIPFPHYDVYVYVSSHFFVEHIPGAVELDGIRYYYRTLLYTSNNFVQITSTSKDEPTFANYAVFQGLSGSSQTLGYELFSPWMNAAGVAGIQIVDASSVQVESETWGAIKTLYR